MRLHHLSPQPSHQVSTSHSEVWNCVLHLPKRMSEIYKFKADTGFTQINYRQG